MLNKSKIAIFCTLAIILVGLSGCSDSSQIGGTGGDLSLDSSNPYGDPIGTSPNNPYPVINQVDNSLTVEIDYYKNEKDVKKREQYYGIGRGFISDVKFAEGTEKCFEYRIKKISQDGCDGKYPYKKLLLAKQSPSLTDEFEQEAYLMEKNFRMESLVLDQNTYDILFLVNKTQTEKLAENGKIVDIVLHSSKLDDLDKPNTARGTITGKNSNGTVVTSGISIREILEDCGQNNTSPLNPSMVGLVQQGPGVDEDDIIALNKKYSEETAVPSQTLIQSLKNKKTALKSLNSGKETYIDKLLSDKIVDGIWYQAGTSNDIPNHPAGSAFSAQSTEIKLDNQIDEIKGKIESSAKTEVVFYYSEGGTSYFNLVVEKNSKKTYHLYRPALYSPTKITSSSSNSEGLSVGKVDIDQKEEKISSDPWCGFTPECKPAIYLYPEKTSLINVKIGPAIGQRTVTIPPYDPKIGWQVTADPLGNIYWGGMSFTHLFYEAMTPDPKIPSEGWIIDGNNVSTSLVDIGQDLGLNQAESKELGRYWALKLQSSPYYFVGLIEQSEIDRLEPLEITPNPDTTIRIRLYFKALNQIMPVANPVLEVRERKGFTAVEWGGYVK